MRTSTHDLYRRYGFFAYSGNDGDLFRKQGLKGWRISDYWGSYVRIQWKEPNWKWITIKEYGNFEELTDEEYNQLENDIKYLIKHKKLSGGDA